jgi:hypothetical protein
VHPADDINRPAIHLPDLIRSGRGGVHGSSTEETLGSRSQHYR